MSSNNVAHVACVDKGLKMKIKRTKGPNRVDAKHEVVKADALSKLATSSSGQSVTATILPSASVPLSVVLSAANASGGQTSSAASVQAATVTPSLTLLSSTSSSIISSSSSSSSSSFMTSSGTMGVPNPTVALQKPGMLPEGYSNNSPAGCSRSPVKANPSGTSGLDSKELKSPKAKAAYNKKVRDNKGKTDGLTTIVPSFSVNGSSIPNTDARTSIGITSNNQNFNSAPTPFTSQAGVNNSAITSEPRPGDTVHMKRENPIHDPYEFNAKVEDKIELPPKKLKLEKTDCIETAISPQPQPQQHASPPLMLHPPSVSKQQQQQHQLQQQHHHHQQQLQQQPQKRSVGVDVRSIGVLTEPDSLGPCEPGTQVGLEGIVWKETDNGLLVVNVTWRGKTYVGTLMDATRYAWAPPRPNGCESPVSDFETRTPKGRGKRNCRNSVQTSEKLPEGRRLRKGRRGTVNSSSSNFTAPPSPAKSDVSSSSNMKRRTKPNDVEGDKAKKSRPCSREVTGADSPTPDGYIVCPEPNCQKKYKHMNGLRYHRTHAHRKSSLTDDAKDEEDEDEDEEEKPDKKEKTPMSERTERMKSKERQRVKEQQVVTDRDSKDSLDDDIPLKEIANKATGQANVHKVDAVKTSTVDEQSNGSDDNGSGVAGLAVSTKNDPQVLLNKPDVNVQREPASPGTSASECKITDSNRGDVSDSSLTVVPSVSSISDISHSSVINNNSNTIDLSSLTTALSQTCNSISTVPLTGVTIVSQASSSLSAVTTETLPPKTSAARQSSATTPTSVLGLTVTADKQNHGRNSISVKPVSSTRPIVPAPSSHTSGVGGAFSHNVHPILFSQGHSSMLKPIQPKPTVTRDYSAPNPILSDLNKEKPRKSKKKKDHGETGISSATVNPDLKGQVSSKDSNRTFLDMISQDDLYRSERTAVIKNSNRPEPFDPSSLSSGVSKLAFQSSVNSNKPVCSLSSDSSSTSGSRMAIPPSSLSVYSSVDSKNMISDDVHSPAYSDISDANDSNSPFQQDSPKKDSPGEKDGQMNGSLHLGQDTNTLSQHYGNMFYFGGPSSYLQHGVGSQISSPNLSDGLKKKDDVDAKRPRSNENSYDKKEAGHNMQETELQQKSLFSYLSNLHSVSPSVAHLQYNLAGYTSPATDCSYANIAQQALDQHKRLQQHHDHTFKSEDGSAKQASSGNSNMNRNVGPGYESSGSKLRTGNDISEGHVHQKWSDSEKHQGVKNRHNDIHHTPKESTELKPHSGLNQDKLNYQMTKQPQNDIHRAQLYKQQKQSIYEHQHQGKRKSQPELTSSSSHVSIASSMVTARSSFENKLQDLIPHDLIKKECVVPEDSTRLEAVNSKQLDTKDSISLLVAKCSSLEPACKSRSPSQSSTPGIPQPSLASSSSSSSSSSSTVSSTVPSSQPSSVAAAALPVSLVNSLPATGTAFPYAPYYPHFRPVQMDTMYRALSPHIIGYTNGPHGYLHPTQLGYRVPVVETGKKSPESAESQRGVDGPGLVNNTVYSPVHKLHELQEKNQRSPGIHSSATNKSGSGDSLHSSSSTNPDPSVEKVKDKQREYSNSPPTQRHVHTHHHTHVMSVYTPDAYSKLMKF